MVKPNATRALAIAAAAGLLGAAAFAVHELAHHLLRREGAALLGPVSKVIVLVLFAFLVLLACRHLCILGLAAWEHWLHTGDEGFFHMHRGRPIYFVTGRLKEIIIRDADKYSPLRLERRLVEALPELSGRLVVLGFPHREHGEEVGAYLEIASLDEALRARIAAAIQAMPVAERPKVVLHGALPIPRTHTGKIQRRKMQPWFADWGAHRGASVIRELPADRPLSS